MSHRLAGRRQYHTIDDTCSQGVERLYVPLHSSPLGWTLEELLKHREKEEEEEEEEQGEGQVSASLKEIPQKSGKEFREASCGVPSS